MLTGRWALLLVLPLVVIAAVAAPSPATFPGPDGLISFSRFVPKTKSNEIFVARPDGSGVQQLTSNPRKFSFESDWSPDGQTIAFDSDVPDVEGHKRAVQVYVMNADGSGLIQLTRGAGFHGAPGFSPDGSRLAIDADWGGGAALQGIWIIPASDPDGVTQAEAQRVTTLPKGYLFDSEPQFSPDGSSIAFARFKDFDPPKSAIHLVNVDGTGLQRLTPWRLNASHPDWSPDGQLITFDSGDFPEPGTKADIYVMRADGSGRTRLTDSRVFRKGKRPDLAQNPVFSPSGTKIMYTLFRSRPFFGGPLVVMNPDGSDKQVVVDGDNLQNRVDWGTHP
jgi:Tol biopolymer transport system component